MNRRFGLIYTIFSLVVLTVLAILVLARLNTARSENLQAAQASFRRLQTELTGEAEGIEEFPELLRDYASLVPNVQALVLFDPDRGLRYVWTAETDVLSVNRDELETFRNFPEYRLSDVTGVRLRNELAVDSAGRIYLDGVYRVLSFEDAYQPLRDSLISLLVFAFLTVLIVLALGRSRDRSAEVPAAASTAAGSAASSAASTAGTAPAATPAPAAAPAPAPETHDVSQPTGDDDVTYEEIPIEELATDPAEPGTLFNPRTGLSHRDHLERRLGLELQRSAYNDQDLTCLIIRFRDLSGDEAYAERARDVLDAFQFEDLCFEYDESSYCVILPNTELPQGLRQAESFRQKHPDTAIGLSARNGRLVEASRVLTEADRSLGHAVNERSGIVGFRPDPRKYRQFVTEHLGADEQ